MQFASPWALILLISVPPALIVALRKRRRPGMRFSSTKGIHSLTPTLKQRLSSLPVLLRVAAFVLLTIALARPQVGIEFVRDITKGIAMELVVDRSGSMGAEMNYDGERLNRLDVVKRVIDEFVVGGKKGLEGRPNDLIGLIAFARYADTICPITLSHGALDGFLDTVKLVQRQEEDGTSIGDAIALAAARLEQVEGTDGYELKSKAIILLTDGQNNAGKRTPLEAAELARTWGIKVYTIGIGGEDSYSTVSSIFGTYRMPFGPGVDEASLSRIAEETGGIFRMADDADALRNVYREIDELEKSEIETIRFQEYREAFVPFAVAALVLLAIAVFLSATIFRRAP